MRGAVRAVIPREENERPECAPSLLSSSTTSRARDAHLHPRRAPAATWRPSRESFVLPSRAGRLFRAHERLGNLTVLCRRCPPTLRSDFPRHCVGCWTSTSHAAPFVVVQGDRRMRRHPAIQRHHPARPKSLEWRTAPRRAARTAGPRRHPSSHRARLPARLAGVRPFEGSRAPVLR